MVRIKILEDDPADRDTLIECLRKYEREQGQSFSITAYDNPSDFMDNYHTVSYTHLTLPTTSRV